GSSADRPPPEPEGYAKSPIAVHRRCACSGVKALRNTSPAKRQAAKLCYRFGPLTPSARSANLIAGDGTKNGFPASNKEPATNQKHDLTGKAPYRFESTSLQRRVMSEPQTVRAQDGQEDRLMDHPEGRNRKRTRADTTPPRTSVRNSDSRPATARYFQEAN